MKPEIAIKAQFCNKSLKADGYDYALQIDTKKAVYKGRKWKYLSNHDKRKYDNLVFLLNPKDHVKILY